MCRGTYLIQQGLKDNGYDPGKLDGLWGPHTELALKAFLAAGGKLRTPAPMPIASDLPWMAIARSKLGLHERDDNAELRAFLRSDDKTLGDPAVLPWCGDFVETCIKLGAPAEELPGDLGANPYWARHWQGFGVACVPTYGAVVVFERGPTSGHVGFLVGQDAVNFYVLGGNQSDGVCVVPITKTRMLASRWPVTFARRPTHLPAMTQGNMTISTNEA